MKDNTAKWRKLDEADVKRQKQKSIDELNNDGYKLYCQCRYKQAANLFSKAASLAKQHGDLFAHCKNIYWEGHCYYMEYKLKKALTCFLEADQLGGLDAVNQFYNLKGLFDVAINLHLPKTEIQSFLNKLIPYKSTQQIGGSKSMVLEAEYTFLMYCDKEAEALAKIQEAFASQIKKAPCYSDNVYFKSLVEAYRLNNMIPDAWAILHRWRKEGKSNFADTKLTQLKAEFELYYYENQLDDAWDVLQRIKAEEQYLGRAGMYVSTLYREIMIGIKTDRLEQIKSALNIIFKKYRNSEDFSDRYMCYKAFARYCCASYQIATQVNYGQMERHAIFWLTKAERMAKYLDSLTQVNWRTKEIQEIRENFKKI